MTMKHKNGLLKVNFVPNKSKQTNLETVHGDTPGD